MKTAMQLHINDMKKIKQMVISKKVDKDLEETVLETIEGCIENAKAYLEAEKQQIVEAAKHGANWDNSPFEGAVQYYDHTYKSE